MLDEKQGIIFKINPKLIELDDYEEEMALNYILNQVGNVEPKYTSNTAHYYKRVQISPYQITTEENIKDNASTLLTVVETFKKFRRIRKENLEKEINEILSKGK